MIATILNLDTGEEGPWTASLNGQIRFLTDKLNGEIIPAGETIARIDEMAAPPGNGGHGGGGGGESKKGERAGESKEVETKASYLKPLAEEDEEGRGDGTGDCTGEEAWACMYMSSHASYFGLKRSIRPNEPHLAIGKVRINTY